MENWFEEINNTTNVSNVNVSEIILLLCDRVSDRKGERSELDQENCLAKITQIQGQNCPDRTSQSQTKLKQFFRCISHSSLFICRHFSNWQIICLYNRLEWVLNSLSWSISGVNQSMCCLTFAKSLSVVARFAYILSLLFRLAEHSTPHKLKRIPWLLHQCQNQSVSFKTCDWMWSAHKILFKLNHLNLMSFLWYWILLISDRRRYDWKQKTLELRSLRLFSHLCTCTNDVFEWDILQVAFSEK